MHRLVWGLVAITAACTSDYERPPTVEYVTAAILAPTCGSAQCHSTFKQSHGDVFDTLEGVRVTLRRGPDSIIFDSGDSNDALNPKQSALIRSVTQTDPFTNIGRMPYDGPMPERDIELLERWIAHYAPGAACDPALPLACRDAELHTCTSDWDFGPAVHTCGLPNEIACSAGACTCSDTFADCDMVADNGCETPLTDDANCGKCGKTCSGMRHCTDRLCVCPTGTDSCMGVPDACETPLNTDLNCGGCGTACNLPETCKLKAGTVGIFKCQP